MTVDDLAIGSPDLPSTVTLARPRRQRQLLLVEDQPGPIVKWPGGKTRILDDLIACLPPDWADGSAPGCYFEPFSGGAALFFHLRPTSAVLSDTNKDLIELYAEIARDPSGLHAQAAELARAHVADPASYYVVRDAWNVDRGKWKAQRRAAAFLYLNKACFNGLFRVNKAGKFNVPIGRSSGSGASWPRMPSAAQLVAAQGALRDARLCCADFVEVVADATRGDLVYFDPPYMPASRTASFTSYSRLGFGPRDHEELARVARDLVDRGVRVMLSSADVPAARELYRGLEISEIRCDRSIGASGASRGRVGELIVTGGYDRIASASAGVRS